MFCGGGVSPPKFVTKILDVTLRCSRTTLNRNPHTAEFQRTTRVDETKGTHAAAGSASEIAGSGGSRVGREGCKVAPGAWAQVVELCSRSVSGWDDVKRRLAWYGLMREIRLNLVAGRESVGVGSGVLVPSANGNEVANQDLKVGVEVDSFCQDDPPPAYVNHDSPVQAAKGDQPAQAKGNPPLPSVRP
ncbi:hypothetical protein C8R44DRAFT_736249 [Mycena epipterygia]|nr:hypothetical protein C8R44DRAFT_736249 [Mycena epipterygia]